jgi:hypothetical protein
VWSFGTWDVITFECLVAGGRVRRCRLGAMGRRVEAYVFVSTENPGPKRVVQEIRQLAGVVRADALLGTPDIVAIVKGEDIASMDAVIDRIAELDGVLDTESKVARWID